ncbi:MAG: flagellar basal body rod C-terminal domain-containing protein [Armatimonadota bacterium]|nr:flagellar basal body rod C-terminal domain-containing protein [Armatimonadota bacterium]MDR7444091.1 flagellar basal body rod C-terminal domain-containing protein [Armatimonadota bacterium]MDR7569508.1 flagellar basal body rod C-terminal domain-containing protein [Armatimonadota bacterium]MDR7613540.1 flagellar basal body rod C-terminal domain-containing protein [Armatimonadota bacterium]
MLRVLQSAAAAMTAEQVRTDLIAHNLANAQTSGFHRLVVAVRPGQEAVLHRRDTGIGLGSLAGAPPAPQAAVDPRPGVLVPTGDPRDLAVEGDGFVVLEGGRLASSGRLGVDTEGYLTLRGIRVEGREGPIRVGSAAFTVRSDGAVAVEGRVVGRLRVVRTASLSPAGSSLYQAPPASLQEVSSAVRTAFQEQPAMNPVQELVQLLAGLRAYEAAAKCVQVADETMGRLSEVLRL